MVRTDDYSRGPGVWKFNNNLLQNAGFWDKVLKIIKDTVQVTEFCDPSMHWECIKMEVTTFCKHFSKHKAQEQCNKLSCLHKEKAELESKLTDSPDNLSHLDRLEKIDLELEQHSREQAEKFIFRSQCTYAREGEKCSAYFLSLEKKCYLEENMKCVITGDGTMTHDQHTILSEQTKFYQELYKSDPGISFNLCPSVEEKLLTDEDKRLCNKLFEHDEFYDALMTLKPNKVPGLDGITLEFYREFWKDLSPFLIAMYRHSYDKGILPESVHWGLISLLPKNNKDMRYVKNMCPLALLNNDYKILTKAIDNRLREILPEIIEIISKDQSGFIKGRKISHNIRKSLDIMDFAKKQNIPMLILTIDMEKCFDHLEHQAIMASLKYLNFSNSFISWIKLFYNKFSICTQNFGYLSDFW